MAVKNANLIFDEIDMDGKIERWERVKHVLVKMTKHQIEKRFDMSMWANKTDCGTVGCAAGHCGLDPWFNRRGFKLVFEEDPVFPYVRWEGGMDPDKFFGARGYDAIFINSALWSDYGVNESPPRVAHRNVLRAVRQYIRELKDLKKATKLL